MPGWHRTYPEKMAPAWFTHGMIRLGSSRTLLGPWHAERWRLMEGRMGEYIQQGSVHHDLNNWIDTHGEIASTRLPDLQTHAHMPEKGSTLDPDPESYLISSPSSVEKGAAQ